MPQTNRVDRIRESDEEFAEREKHLRGKASQGPGADAAPADIRDSAESAPVRPFARVQRTPTDALVGSLSCRRP
jgi:hypothetical protein